MGDIAKLGEGDFLDYHPNKELSLTLFGSLEIRREGREGEREKKTLELSEHIL